MFSVLIGPLLPAGAYGRGLANYSMAIDDESIGGQAQQFEQGTDGGRGT
jgi:hypothetical protein